jgi:6-phosphogluconolactonase
MNRSFRRALGLLLGLMLLEALGCQTAEHGTSNQGRDMSPRNYFVYVGTFTAKSSKGIYRMKLDGATGRLSEPELAAESDSPSFLVLRPDGKFLYCVNEVDKHDGKPGGAVSAFAIDPGSGALTSLNQQPSGGGGPTHIDCDRTGTNVLVANYGSGSVAVLPIGEDGRLAAPSSVDQHTGKGTDPGRQEGPHAHCVVVDPANAHALSCDLGLDKVFVYKFDPAAGTITRGNPPAADVAPGSGPRHLAFHPSGKFVYVTNEMGCTVMAFNYDSSRGELKQFQTISTLASESGGQKSSAEIAVHPSGKFLYVSNRDAANNIAIFKIDQQTGKLTASGHISTQGKAPRSFGIDPTGRWLIAANQDTDNIVVFGIDQTSGGLKPTGQNIAAPTPVCITFLPMGR